MRIQYLPRLIVLLVAVLGLSVTCRADNSEKTVQKAVGRSTLNQPGTRPFHLKAMIAPSLDRDRESNRTGQVEIWWASPTQWEREVRSPEFHQIMIVNGDKESQKNEGDYFPEWLRETCVALIEPVPSLQQVLEQVKNADVKSFMGTTYFSWTVMSTNGKVKKGMGAGLAITDSTGLLLYGGDLGWGGLYEDYKGFHGRMVARTVSLGSPEVTARITTLEDLRDLPPGFFDVEPKDAAATLLQTVVVDETTLRKNLLSTEAVTWPALQDGPLEGAVTTEVVVDRAGKVRDVGTIVSDNSGVDETAAKAIATMQFRPYVQGGVAVQVVSRITMLFKSVRPTSVAAFDSARNYFEHGRHVSFPAAGNGQAYVLHATFQAKVLTGEVEDGEYVDTWKSDKEWRRKARIGNSLCVRARHGDTRYQSLEGPDVSLLRLVLRVMEPIPAMDTFVESDWRIKQDTVDGVKTIRVLSGYEGPQGEFDSEQTRGYWFDESGKLVKTYFSGLEAYRSDFIDFDGIQVAHEIKVLRNGGIGMIIQLNDISPVGSMPDSTFELKGHEWNRAFTDEVR